VTVEFRRLALRDLPAIEAIERRAYRTPWSRSMFAGELAKPSSVCLGAFDEGAQLLGYLIISRYVDAWHVMNIATDPDHRRRGIATALLERLFELTANDGERGYTLEVRVSNEDAIRLYERLGFQARGVRRGYYTDNREDALVMWKEPSPVFLEERERNCPPSAGRSRAAG
jgi:ribosomal-protein-alanine N-acetyltransferase